jgi:alpha-amylase/alpha-mannosidase (GH57 family)
MRFAHLEDAEAHIALAVAPYCERFGCEPRGMWPAQGTVAEALMSLCILYGIQWIATDEGVLARS